jgi:hypothetical protein
LLVMASWHCTLWAVELGNGCRFIGMLLRQLVQGRSIFLTEDHAVDEDGDRQENLDNRTFVRQKRQKGDDDSSNSDNKDYNSRKRSHESKKL